MFGLPPLIERRVMKAIVATAANLGRHGDLGSHGDIPDVCDMAGSRPVAILALYSDQMRGRSFILESQGCAIADRVAGQARTVVLLVDCS